MTGVTDPIGQKDHAEYSVVIYSVQSITTSYAATNRSPKYFVVGLKVLELGQTRLGIAWFRARHVPTPSIDQYLAGNDPTIIIYCSFFFAH